MRARVFGFPLLSLDEFEVTRNLEEGKALDNIDLSLVSHRYVSGVLEDDDHFVSACSLAPRV